jgi:hypothetical protein
VAKVFAGPRYKLGRDYRLVKDFAGAGKWERNISAYLF